MVSLKGGDKLEQALKELSAKVKTASTVRIGFLEDATYPNENHTPVAKIAVIQEFGARIEVPEHETTIYRKTNKAGTEFLRNGRFVKKKQSNFASTHTVPAHTIVIPPRPFFRTMISNNSGQWPKMIGDLLEKNKYDSKKTLDQAGKVISEQLQQSIRDFDSVPLATSTIKKKGFDKQLVDTRTMLRSVDYEVE